MTDTLSNQGQASQRARQVMRDLVTAAAAIGDAEDGDEIGKVERINAALDRLEDLAVEALVAAGREGDTDFEAGAAFDLFWPEGLPAPAPVSTTETVPAGRFQCVPRQGEPSFLLLGRDASADGLVEIWCEARRMMIALGLKPKSDLAKVIEAHNVGQRMRDYRRNVEVEARMQRAGLAPPPDDSSAAHGHEHPQPD